MPGSLMMDPRLTGNLLAWMAQSCIIAVVAALLPLLFRVRHAGTRVLYGRAAIAVCLLLPLLQPRTDHPSPFPAVGRGLLWILATGAFLRLAWIGCGLWRIRNYRIAATPLYPVPEGLQAASAVTHADALFCISRKTAGPVMLGWLAPVVLLPESFEGLSEESQCGIACHELLHVRRGDWLIGLIEELVAALLWFNPGVWLLLSQTRLALEQLVDGEVVRLTGVRDQYIDALMAMARARVLDSVPAPLFLRRRHLSQRMLALLSEPSKSGLRLAASYASIGAIVALTGWMAAAAFPLAQPPLPAVATTPRVTAVPATGIRPQIARATPEIRLRPARPLIATSAPPDTPPPDPREPVTGGIEIASTADQRAAALQFLDRARRNAVAHNRNMPPFHFTVSLTAGGNVADTGAGELTEVWMNGQKWRWTVQLGKTSLVRIASRGKLYENAHVDSIAMRAHMLRNEIYWAGGSPARQVRTAQILWQGNPATCILTSDVTGAAAQTQARLWEEEEYCVDNASGLLLLHSVAPGTFAVFAYDPAQQFYGRSLPSRIAIYVADALAADASFHITDTDAQDEAAVTPGPGMISDPPPLTTQMPGHMSIAAPAGVASVSPGSIQSVMVHAEVNGVGNVVESEISATANPALNQFALDIAAQEQFGYTGSQRQLYLKVVFGEQ